MKIHRYNYTYKLTHTYAVFILRFEFFIATVQTKLPRSCPHRMGGSAELSHECLKGFSPSYLSQSPSLLGCLRGNVYISAPVLGIRSTV